VRPWARPGRRDSRGRRRREPATRSAKTIGTAVLSQPAARGPCPRPPPSSVGSLRHS